MENRKYLTMESFWMFVAGLMIGMMVIMAVLLSKTLNVGEDGQTRLLRSGTTSTKSIQSATQTLSPVTTQDAVSGIGPSYTTGTVSGIGPSYTPQDTVSGIGPSY